MTRLLATLALTTLFGVCAIAQTETGQITGTVADATGAAVPGAAVTVTSAGTGATRATTSSSDGTYTVTNLLPGEYNVAVVAQGFNRSEKRVTVAVGSRVGQDFQLEVGAASTVLEVSESAVQVNTETPTLSQVITEQQIRELPNLTRNPYEFVALAGNVSEAGMGTRGAGFAINGQRESSTNILLDGASNNDEFAGTIGQQVPLDSVQEFSVLTSNFTAEYGRASGGIVNVVTRSGSNDFHGTAYEFNRVSKFSSNSFQANANGVPKSVFDRNQFGYSLGGPAIKNKLFFFSSTEWIRVRSNAVNFAWVPTPELIGASAPATQAFFQSLGQLRSNASIIGTINLNQLTALSGTNPCASAGCSSLSPTLPLFSHVSYNVPTDAGGGYPQNTYMTVNRVDYNMTDKTQMYFRYALYSELDFPGVLSSSPYNDFDFGQTYFNNNVLLSMIHTFSPRWTSQTKLTFNRLTNIQPGTTARGLVPTMYANPNGPVSIGADYVAFPGYNPFTPGNGGAFGGPQNIGQLYEDLSYARGKHDLRFGGTYIYMRDNRTYAAYQTAVDSLATSGGLGGPLTGLLNGQFAQIRVAVDPQGHFPCVNKANPTPDCEVTLPVTSPNFSRSNRYNEFALYGQDSWKVTPRLTINLGLRWEFFGVQHNKNPMLDSNLYDPSIGFADNNLAQYIRNGQVLPAPKSSIGELWKPSWTNLGPRLGFAYDIFGDGKTSFRGGWGRGFERNFGNVTFNLIQNPPNYAVLNSPGPITTENFGPLAGNGGTLALPPVGLRIVDPNIKTAYADMWNVALEHQFGQNTIWSVEYSGSRGVNLYSISYPNRPGYGNAILGDPCTGNQDCNSLVRQTQYSTSIGYRGNQGFSHYNGLNNRLVMRNFFRSGVDMTVNYTWSHAIDNLSSTFFEAAGVANVYGNANITTNNGNFVLGLLDPYHPGLDRGNADFDVRHRVVVAGNWMIPTGTRPGLMGALLRGWSLNPLFTAHTGQMFSVFDSSLPAGPTDTMRASFAKGTPNTGNGMIATSTPDTYQYLTFNPSQIITPQPGRSAFVDVPPFPSTMSGRNAFHGPGWWNLDVGVYKQTKLTERLSLELRAETFNIFNHANLYVVGNSADVGSQDYVTGCYGCTGSTYDRRHLQLAAKFIF